MQLLVALRVSTAIGCLAYRCVYAYTDVLPRDQASRPRNGPDDRTDSLLDATCNMDERIDAFGIQDGIYQCIDSIIRLTVAPDGAIFNAEIILPAKLRKGSGPR